MPSNKPNTIRIIGGAWRGRKIPVPPVAGVRPTGDRIRETLFNWLMFDIQDARCLDLFAGSGILGLEALSRGAKSVEFVDKDKTVCQHLTSISQDLNIENATITCAPASATLSSQATHDEPAFNIVFLDPPFRQNILPGLLQDVLDQKRLAPDAKVYVEVEKEFIFELPAAFNVLKDKTSGDVRYLLLQWVEGSS
jgi:16S rRNA (guanine966-N2)-methyltransferase